MSNKILFVFEGARTEGQIILHLQNFFLKEDTTIKCVYGAEIYQIYKEISADNDLDSFNLLKERSIENKTILENYSREDFAEIYMFFDYDGHSSLADDDRLKELLDFFDEETDKGKLYISYPMVEALKHICDYNTFKDLAVNCKENIGYKQIVAKDSIKEFINFNSYQFPIWKQLINIHLKKMNYIVNGSFSLSNELYSQLLIFSKQLEKYILPYSKVAVLSAFPIFLNDYYGCEEIKKQIE